MEERCGCDDGVAPPAYAAIPGTAGTVAEEAMFYPATAFPHAPTGISPAAALDAEHAAMFMMIQGDREYLRGLPPEELARKTEEELEFGGMPPEGIRELLQANAAEMARFVSELPHSKSPGDWHS